MNEKAPKIMTPEAKRKLHEMLYYVAMSNRPRGSSYSTLKCYITARNQANWILESIGEKLDEE